MHASQEYVPALPHKNARPPFLLGEVDVFETAAAPPPPPPPPLDDSRSSIDRAHLLAGIVPAVCAMPLSANDDEHELLLWLWLRPPTPPTP
jgi:hypothetical protein